MGSDKKRRSVAAGSTLSPRIVITLLFSANRPPPSETDMPGIARISSCTSVMLADSISSPVMAEILKGMSRAFISRLVAVTIISSRETDSTANA